MFTIWIDYLNVIKSCTYYLISRKFKEFLLLALFTKVVLCRQGPKCLICLSQSIGLGYVLSWLDLEIKTPFACSLNWGRICKPSLDVSILGTVAMFLVAAGCGVNTHAVSGERWLCRLS